VGFGLPSKGFIPNLLIHFDTTPSTVQVDSSPYAKTINNVGSAGVITITVAQKKFGPSSLDANGGGYCSIGPYSDLVIGTKDFTVECWVRCVNNSAAHERRLWDYSIGGSGFYVTTVGDALHFINGAGTTNGAAGTLTSTGVWRHIAVVRSGTTTKAYIDGVLDITVADGTSYAATTFGITQNGPISFAGQVDECRVVVGTAVYTANFTPPTAPFPNS
jgi:hypothetical protein